MLSGDNISQIFFTNQRQYNHVENLSEILNVENPNPIVIKDLKFYFASEWNPTAIGEFRRVWLTTPVCESTLPDDVGNFRKREVGYWNTVIYWKSFGGQSRIVAEETCKSKGLVIYTLPPYDSYHMAHIIWVVSMKG